MNFALSLEDFNKNQILFLEPKKNIIMDGHFTKLIYSNSHITMNGLYFALPLQIQTTDYISNRHIIRFSVKENAEYIAHIIDIEHQIIEYFKQYYGITKYSAYILHDHLHNGHLKFFSSIHDSEKPAKECDINTRNIQYLLKISGLWENENSVGLTYKVVECIKRPLD